MSLIKSLYERKGNIIYQMQEAVKKAEGTGADLVTEEFDKWNADLKNIEGQIEAAEKVRELSAAQAQDVDEPTKKAVSPEERYGNAFNDFLRSGELDMAPENRSILRAGKVSMKDAPMGRAAQQSVTTTAGGYTIPTQLFNEIMTAQKYFGGMLDRSLCRWITTRQGGTLNVPLVDDTGNIGYKIGEATDFNTSATAVTFGQGTLNDYKYTSGMIRISRELLQDSDFNIEAYLVELMTERLFRILNQEFTKGDGSGDPNGVVTASNASESLAKRSVAVSDLRNLMYSVNKAYRTNGKWMFHDSTEKLIRAIALDGTYFQNQSLWQPSFKDGVPDTIMGKPYIVNNDVAEIPTTGLTAAKVILFGDFKHYVIRETLPMTIVRVNELYAATDEVGFVLIGRYDADLMAASTTYPIRHGYMATT
jgi:HK97 family phage major capsid protein